MILHGVYEGSRYLLYALCEPRTLEVRYVGLSTTGLERPRSHWRSCSLRADQSKKAKWLRALKARGQEPVVLVLEEFASADGIGEAERRAIAWYKENGTRLTNATEGGELGYRAIGAKREPPTLEEFRESVKQRLIRAVVRDWEAQERWRQQELEWIEEHFGPRSRAPEVCFASELESVVESEMPEVLPKTPKSAIEAAERFRQGQEVRYKHVGFPVRATVTRVIRKKGELWLRVMLPGDDLVVRVCAEDVLPAKATFENPTEVNEGSEISCASQFEAKGRALASRAARNEEAR
jgi:hypothetical protein